MAMKMAKGRMKLNISPSGKMGMARGDAVAKIEGTFDITNAEGEVLALPLAAILWGPDETVASSYIYTYDTTLGASDPAPFAGWLAQPELEPGRAFTVLKLQGDNSLTFAPPPTAPQGN